MRSDAGDERKEDLLTKLSSRKVVIGPSLTHVTVSVFPSTVSASCSHLQILLPLPDPFFIGLNGLFLTYLNYWGCNGRMEAKEARTSKVANHF